MSRHPKNNAAYRSFDSQRKRLIFAGVSACFACTAGTSPAYGQDARLIFTTSVSGNGDLSSWPAAAAEDAVGLAAADAICEARAQAAGLPEPQAFVAWLSDQNTDAYCRLFGLEGKRSANCGLAQLPMSAGPWVRTDGIPFAESLATLLNGEVLSPPLTDEFGHRFSYPYRLFTATAPDGTLQLWDDTLDCNGWTEGTYVNNILAAQGSVSGTTSLWTDSGGGTSCEATARLVCMQRGVASPLPERPIDGKPLAFLTASNVGGNLDGIVGADALCNTAASAADLPDAGFFKALAIPSEGIPSIASRFKSDGPWYRPDGMLFASSMADILAARAATPLNVTENGSYVGYAVALTGSGSSGLPAGLNCSMWTSNSGLAAASLVNQTFFENNARNWLGSAQVDCSPVLQTLDWPKKLYCLSDPGVFGGDFE